MKKVLLSFTVAAVLIGSGNVNAMTVQTKQATTAATQAADPMGMARIVDQQPTADGKVYLLIQGDDGTMYRSENPVDQGLVANGDLGELDGQNDGSGNFLKITWKDVLKAAVIIAIIILI